MTNQTMKCPVCGCSDDISIDDFGGAFCMECEHEWPTTVEDTQRAKAVRWLSAFSARHDHSVSVDSPVSDFLRAMRKLDSDGDFLDEWDWSAVWSVLAYWIHEDEADHGPVVAA